MERIINSIYGVVIFYIIIAILTLAVSGIIKKRSEGSNNYINPYLAYVTADKNL